VTHLVAKLIAYIRSLAANLILLTDSGGADAHMSQKANSRTVSIDVDDEHHKDSGRVGATHDATPGAQWL